MPKHIGLDLGTSNTRMFIRGRGIVLRSPTVVTVDLNEESVVAVGREAKNMIGKTPANMKALKPIRNGVVADFEVAAMMVHEHLVRTEALSLFNRPVILVSIPESCTEVERRAVEDVMFAAGARAVGTVSSSVAAAVGAGLNINSPNGCMIVDIGGGMTQIAVISSGGIVRSRSVKIAGEHFDGAIVRNLRSARDLFVGDVSAEMLKVRLGAATNDIRLPAVEVSGRNEKLKCAQTIAVTQAEVQGALFAGYEAICRAITSVLESSPPEIAGDISDYGIMLVGGGANIHGIAELINRKTRLRVTVAKNPMDSECLGLGRLIEHPSIIPGGILYKNR